MGTKAKKEEEVIRQMVRERLQARLLTTTPAPSGKHLDDDTMAAFFEARLGEVESGPVIAHLVSCASCRHATADLARFDSDFNDTSLPATGDEPGSLRQWFEDFKAGLGTSSEEVFAYQNPPDDSKSEQDLASDNDDEPAESPDSK